MKKVIKFVKGKRDDKKDGGLTPSQSGELISPAQTPEDERFLGLDSSTGYFVDFCGKDKTLTKLHKAAWQGNLDKVKNALKKVDIDTVDRHNRTALHFAVVKGHPSIVWFLLGNNAKHHICDDDGRTPLLKAIECGHKECMNLLLERGANVNHADFSGTTSLHIVVNQGADEVAATLLRKGADVEVANNSGEYPLHIAIRTQNKEMVELLLSNGASVNAVDREHRTPLMLASKSGNVAFAQLFFEYGAQLHVVDSNGWTAVDYALLGGHQNAAAELKNFLKKESKPGLETHTEEDEGEAVKSDGDTWNDSHLSDFIEEKVVAGKIGQFFRKCSVESDGGAKSEKDDDIIDSPGTGIVPPPCQPPRSWEIIEAGMIDETAVAGAEPKRRSITALGSLLSRRESFTDNSGSQSDCPKYTLSLNRRKDSKKNIDVKQRFSFNEEESLRSFLSDDFSLLGKDDDEDAQNIMRMKRREQKERKTKSGSGSDWDSNLSSLLESDSAQQGKKRHSLPGKGVKDVGHVDRDGTFGRRGTMNEIEELWVLNTQVKEKDTSPDLPPKVEEETEVGSSWDSGDSFGNEAVFPPPPTAFELGVDMAKSISYMKGISIDHTPGYPDEHSDFARPCCPPQSQSLDCLDEKDVKDIDRNSDKTASGQRHVRQPSISEQKWRSVEFPPQQRPTNRLIDVNRRINEQLECYDQALRELAECSYSRKQDAIISKLTSNKSSQVENYYSLPSVKYKGGTFSFTKKPFDGQIDYRMSLPLQFSKKPDFFNYNKYKQTLEINSGPSSLPYSTNTPAEQLQKLDEVENNERLGFEDEFKINRDKESELLHVTDNEDMGSLSSNSEEPCNNDKNDRKTKRHILLAMRDVKHAVQVTHSFKTSLDDQILSPLTKIDGMFNLSPKKSISENIAPDKETCMEEPAFFRGESDNALERQETVIERTKQNKAKSSSSESGEEPTLWLQETVEKAQASAASSDDEEKGLNGGDNQHFSPLGAVYEEIQAEKLSKSHTSSPETSRTSNRKSPVAAFMRLQRLDSSSDIEESLRDEKALREDASPDASFSSGPIDPLGKDSGSDHESSRNDFTPVHRYSIKKHHKWLKDRLQSENKERHQLEEVAAQLAEKAERLQYELADAKEATKSRDEIISLLQGQLARMEDAYTKSLEESVHCRLQLTALEQEILHLKEVCSQYEDERDGRCSEGSDKQASELGVKVRQLEEEREGLSKIVVRLEKENRLLEKLLNQGKSSDGLDEKHRWKERCLSDISNQFDLPEDGQKISAHDDSLKIRNNQLETQISLVNEINKQLENRLDALLESRKLSSHEEINESILLLNKKNSELENQMKILIEELDKKKSVRDGEADSIVDKLNREKQSFEKTGDGNITSSANETEVDFLRSENKSLMQTIANMKEEISRLKQRPNIDKSFNNRLNKEDEILSEKEMLLFSTMESREHAVDQTKTFQVDLEETEKGSAAAEFQMRSMKANDLRFGSSRVGRKDELAWSNLYGIKHVPTSRSNSKQKLQVVLPDKDSEEFIELKVKELEQELEKTKEGIMKQQIETNLRMQSITQNSKVLELKKKVLSLESEINAGNELNSTLERKTIELSLGLKEKRKIEFELENLKSIMQREYVPKVNAEISEYLSERRSPPRKVTSTVCDNLKERCAVLARERDRAYQLRRRLGRHCSSWEDGSESQNNEPLFHSLTRAKTTLLLPTDPSQIDEGAKVEVASLLDSSIKKYSHDLHEDGDGTPLRIELLKKKNLL